MINYESTWRNEKSLLNWAPNMVICDESSKIKNHNSKQSKCMHKLGAKSKYNLILTGTPINNNPLDIFSQYKFLDSSIFGISYYAFRSKYAITNKYFHHQLIGYKNMKDLSKKAHSVAYRVKLEDAVELPPFVDTVRNIKLEGVAKQIYQDIDKDSYAKLLRGEITTPNVLTRLLRLSQCTGGFVKFEESVGNQTGTKIQQISTQKLDALKDIIECAVNEEKKVVVFARFIPEIEAIEKMLQSMEIKYALIKGDVKDRQSEVNKFQNNKDVRVFVGQIATTGMGLTLTAASIVVYYSLDFSYSNYEQSRARIRRIGQDKKCLYIHLIAQNTIDEKIMEALKKKADIAKLLIDELREKAIKK